MKNDSPYQPILSQEISELKKSQYLTWLMLVVTIVCGVSTGLVVFLSPNLERWLKMHAPGQHMPDAFANLNGSIPVFMVMLTATSAILLWLTANQRRGLLIPLAAGPTMCFVGWWVSEDFVDPNWFHLFALTTIGMIVSCAVTLLLALVRN